MFSPTLLIVELAAVVARAFNDAQRGIAYARAVRQLPRQVWLPLDGGLVDVAMTLAAQHQLRGADAVYMAVAQQTGAILVTGYAPRRLRLRPGRGHSEGVAKRINSLYSTPHPE